MALRLRTRSLVSCLVLLYACGPSSAPVNQPYASSNAPAARMLTQAGANNSAVTLSTATRSGPAQSTVAALPSSTAQRLVRSAALAIEVNSVNTAIRSADSLVRQHGAMLADSKRSQDADGHHQAELDIRVPSDSFARMIAALRQLGDVRSEEVNTQDVTKDYIDLETRLAVKAQEVTRLRALLDTRTAKLTDVLDVERELTRAVSELEEMKGEQQYYDQQIALSSITLTLMDRTASSGAQISGPVRDAFRNSLGVLGTSLSGLIYLVAIVLPWAIIALVVWWIAIRLRARIRKPPPR